MAEAIDECAALLGQMREQLRELLTECRDDGLVLRFLFENREAADRVIGEPIDAFFARSLGGDLAEAHSRVARSYLESGFFDEALGALGSALEHRAEDPQLARDLCYASGMAAYRRGEYDQALDALELWITREIPDGDRRFVSLAQNALEGMPALLTPSSDPSCAGRARALLEALGAAA
jgi:tetratricopeptide (TPR) repeat protein